MDLAWSQFAAGLSTTKTTGEVQARGEREGATEEDPRRTSRVGVPVWAFRTWLSFSKAQRTVWHNGLQNTDTWRGHTQTRCKAPPPPPFLLFVGCNFYNTLSSSLYANSLPPSWPLHAHTPLKLPGRGVTSQTNMSSKLFHFLISTFSRVITGKTQGAGKSVYSWHNQNLAGLGPLFSRR